MHVLLPPLSLSRGRPRSDPRICCRHQWRAPGYAPVIDSCGTAGGRLPARAEGALYCQSEGLVPIVEPDLVLAGTHTLEDAVEVTLTPDP